MKGPAWRLHVRARMVFSSGGALVVLTVAAWGVAGWLAGQPSLSGSQARIPVVAVAPVVAAVLVVRGLGGADDGLERATPRWRPGPRARHLLIAAVVVAVALPSTVTAAPDVYGAWVMLRNVIGYLGVAGLGAVLVGPRLTWVPLLLYAAVAYMAAPRTPSRPAVYWAWPTQPSATATAWVMALGLASAGAVLYVFLGPRSARSEQPQ